MLGYLRFFLNETHLRKPRQSLGVLSITIEILKAPCPSSVVIQLWKLGEKIISMLRFLKGTSLVNYVGIRDTGISQKKYNCQALMNFSPLTIYIR